MSMLLDKQGLALTFLMAILIFAFGGLQYLGIMLVFFFSAILVTKYEHQKKREMGIYEHERSWENVLSNGIMPTILAVFSNQAQYGFLGGFVGFQLGFIPYLASVAAVTADKFASELGVLSGKPISLENLKPAKPGKSGAISFLGLLVSLAGGSLIGGAAMFIFNINATQALFIGIIGFIGSLIDSLFGILEER